MAKLRKTRAHKEATAQKRSDFTYSFKPIIHVGTPTGKPQKHHETTTAIYIKKDLQTTVFTSLSLIAAQLILFYLLQHHVVKIPGVSY